ncbi:hypothetical protein M8312_09260 [Sphingomonas sp. KRR8]|uniref:hypothetical protein n=1 Tax=Sphingomonas sp. KRR8 TaxID=2942996 RepID=UPI00201FF334|nr:hypothetical protein [Sphingomonas sp. KRR8]URD59988.1 hypothetical protein M8312_09260 [Sphingomonas sp. KRR8]
MRYFLDCEYDGWNGPLLSLALVPEDGGEEFYVVIKHERPLTDWVERHVAPYFWTVPEPHKHDPLDTHEAAELLSQWLAGLDEVEIIADWPEDISLFCRLIMTGSGEIVRVPRLTFRFVRLPGFSTARNSVVPHNALHDARSLRDHFTHLE